MRKSAKIGGQGERSGYLGLCWGGGQAVIRSGVGDSGLVELPVGLMARRQLPGGEAGGALAPRLQP